MMALEGPFLAAVIARLPDPALGGVHHWAGDGVATWFDVASLVVETLRAAGGPAARLERIGTADWPTAARRPSYSVLDCGRLAGLLDTAPADWQSGVADSVQGALEQRHLRDGVFAS